MKSSVVRRPAKTLMVIPEQLLANFRRSQKTRREPQSHSLSSHPTPEASATALFR